MKISTFNLGNFVINGFDSEYIFSIIKNTNDFYEIDILEDWNKYFENVKVILDIGANIGNHSIYWSQNDNIQKIIAFEPLELNFRLLEKNITDNHINKVEIHQLGLGKRDGYAVIDKIDHNNLGATSLKFVENKGDIKIVSGDYFVSNINYPIDFIKIDVEEFEIDVLNGFEQTIKKYKPIIWVEITLNTLKDVLNFLEKKHYCIVDISKFNILAIHKTKIENLNEISKEDLIENMLQNLENSWKSQNNYLKAKKIGENRLSMLLDRENQLLYEIEKYQELITKYNGIRSNLYNEIGNVDKLNKETILLEGQNVQLEDCNLQLKVQNLQLEREKVYLEGNKVYLESLIKSYRSRKIVRFADSIKKDLNYFNLYLKNIFNREKHSLTKLPTSEVTVPEVSASGVISSEVSTPVVSDSKVSTLGVSDSEISSSGVSSSEVSASGVSAPGISNSGVSESSVSTSGISKNQIKKIKDIKVAVILDEFSYNSFKYEFDAIDIEPSNWLEIFKTEKPDLFLCESAWSGGCWKGLINFHNSKVETRTVLLDILKYCNDNGIPTIFWNKEDPTNFNAFYDTALRFDHIFTTDEDCVKRYKEEYGHNSVYCLLFGAQPKLFNPIEKQERSDDIIFAGSWYVHHKNRSIEMTDILDNIIDSGYKLKIYDRFYELSKEHPRYRFPNKYHKYINRPVLHDQIEKVYKESKYSLNINTVTNSRTMFARRVFELMLCNTFVLSNYSKGVYDLFGDNVAFVSKDKIDLSNSQKKQMNNLYNVLKNHTYTNRFKQILDTINYEYLSEDKTTTIYYIINSQSEIDEIIEHYESITYNSKKLVLLLSKQLPKNNIKNIYRKYANGNVSVYSLDIISKEAILDYLTTLTSYHNGTLHDPNEIISNHTPYFIFANIDLDTNFIEKAILHYSYIGSKFGIALGDNFKFKRVKNIENVLMSEENFIIALKNILDETSDDETNKFSIYEIQI